MKALCKGLQGSVSYQRRWWCSFECQAERERRCESTSDTSPDECTPGRMGNIVKRGEREGTSALPDLVTAHLVQEFHTLLLGR